MPSRVGCVVAALTSPDAAVPPLHCSLRAEHDAAGKELAALEQRHNAHNGRIAQATQLSGEAANMVRLWQDAAERYALADTAERSIAHLKGAAKSMEQLNTEIKAAEARLSEEEHKCQKLRERLQLMQTELLDVRGGPGAWPALSDPDPGLTRCVVAASHPSLRAAGARRRDLPRDPALHAGQG
jgi:hypothetical protein